MKVAALLNAGAFLAFTSSGAAAIAPRVWAGVSLAVVLVLLLAPGRVSGEPSRSASPDGEYLCAADVSGLAALDFVQGKATTYAIAFAALNGQEGDLSGTVSVFAGNARYDIPFRELYVPSSETSGDRIAPLVVQFPAPVLVNGAYLSAIEGSDGGPCGLMNVLSVNASMLAKPNEQLVKLAQGLTRVASPTPVTLPPPDCAVPYAEATMTHGAQAAYPEIARDEGGGEVSVRVGLSAGGEILYTNVIGSSGNPALDAAAVDSARASAFRPQVFRCIDVAGPYRFVVDFRHS